MIGLFAWLRKKRLTADPMVEQKWLLLQSKLKVNARMLRSKLMVDARLFCFFHNANKVTVNPVTRCDVAGISNNASHRIR